MSRISQDSGQASKPTGVSPLTMCCVSTLLVLTWTILPLCPPLNGCRGGVCSRGGAMFLWTCVLGVDIGLVVGTAAYALYHRGYAAAELVCIVFFVLVPGMALATAVVLFPLAINRGDRSYWLLVGLALSSFLPVGLSGSADRVFRPTFDIKNRNYPLSVHQPPMLLLGCRVSKRTARPPPCHDGAQDSVNDVAMRLSGG